MAYVADGSMDREGRKFEKQVEDILNNDVQAQIKLLGRKLEENEIAQHVGGSNGHSDVDIIDTKTNKVVMLISVKRKSKIGKTDGGITYKNFTFGKKITNDENMEKVFNECIFWMNDARERYQSGVSKDIIRSEQANLSNRVLRTMSNSTLKSLIENSIVNRDSGYDSRLVFGNEDWTVNESMAYSEIPIVRDWNNVEDVILNLGKSNTKQSCKVKFLMKDGTVSDYGLRVRVHTNNGISALVGDSGSNNSSAWCMKFQQDTVQSMLTK
jgi:hypothetical protein